MDPYESDAMFDAQQESGAIARQAMAMLQIDRLLPQDCACFQGVCRGDVVDGRLSNGWLCKEAKTPRPAALDGAGYSPVGAIPHSVRQRTVQQHLAADDAEGSTRD